MHVLRVYTPLGKVCAPVPGGLKLTRNDLEAAILGSPDALLGHALAGHPPLGLQHRLYDVLAAAAQRHAHGVVLAAPEQALAVQPLHHCLAHLQRTSKLDGQHQALVILVQALSLQKQLAL